MERCVPAATEIMKKCVKDAMLSVDNLIDYLKVLENVGKPTTEGAGFTALLQNLAITNSNTPFDGINSLFFG